MRFRLSFVCLFFVAMFLMSFPDLVQASGSQETLNQYVSDLQKNPTDQALREKIIKLALTLNPKPVVPQDVVMHEGAAEYAIKHAKTATDFADAAKEYEQALLSAPWIAADYFNCGVAYEKAEQYDAAIRNFNLYLAASPGAKDTNDVLKRIGGLEYAANKAAKGPSQEAVVAQEQNKSEDWSRKLDGRRYTCPEGYGQTSTIDVRGNVLVWGNIMPDGAYSEAFRSELRGSKSPVPFDSNSAAAQLGLVESTLTISEDGNSMTNRMRYRDGDVHEHIYLWQKI